jgi:hypothetical protein
MDIPPMTAPEVMFGVMVLVAFAAFVTTLAGVHLYVMLAPERSGARPVDLSSSGSSSAIPPRRPLIGDAPAPDPRLVAA